MQFGYEGLGLFYTLLEKFAQQEKPIKTEVLKVQLRIGKKLEKVWKFMEEIGLISSNNGETFNKQLLNFSETYQIKKEKNRERILKWRENQSDTKNVTRYKSVCNTPKVKESKVNENKFVIPTILEIKNYCLEIKNNVDAEKFFNFYESKGWMVGKNKMKDWKACIRTWESKETHQYSNLKPQDSRINHLESLHNAVIERDKQRNENI